jgi:hypothetical protein
MNANIFALLIQYVPAIIAWVEKEKPVITTIIQDAQSLVSALQNSGTAPATAQATGGLALLGQLLSHAATTLPTTPVVAPPK